MPNNIHCMPYAIWTLIIIIECINYHGFACAYDGGYGRPLRFGIQMPHHGAIIETELSALNSIIQFNYHNFISAHRLLDAARQNAGLPLRRS